MEKLPPIAPKDATMFMMLKLAGAAIMVHRGHGIGSYMNYSCFSL
jgi:hypothetical protein